MPAASDQKTGVPTRRTGRRRYLNNVFLHFRPTTVPAATLPLTLSWGLGGMAALLLLTQMLTGVLLNFVYEPVPTLAYTSILTILHDVPFGRLVRNLHHWGANLLVLISFLHMLRVFFTGAFYVPRRVNWFVGLGLLAMVLGANFSGYLLPYDQLAYWAVTICTGMLDYVPGIGEHLKALIMAGDEIGPAALKLFFTIHTTILPMTLVALAAYHFWRVRKAGGLVRPRSGDDRPSRAPLRVATVPNLLVREMAVAAVLLAILVLLAVGFDAPLHAPANPGLSPNPTKAPWYFAGLQELLQHFPPALAVTVMPLLGLLVLAAIPFLGEPDETAGNWFGSRRDRWITGMAAVAGGLITLDWVFWDEYGRLGGSGTGARVSLAGGWMVLFFWVAGLAGLYWGLRRWGKISRHGALQAMMALLVCVFITLTIVTALFRGPGMHLTWPGG